MSERRAKMNKEEEEKRDDDNAPREKRKEMRVEEGNRSSTCI